MDDEQELTPLTKLYWAGLLEKDRGTWVYRDGEGNEAEVRARREDDHLEIIATTEAGMLFNDVERGDSLGRIPIEELNDQDRQFESSIITLDEALEIGEATKIELKRECPPDASKLAKEVVALANTWGGVLVLGAKDDGSIHGLEDVDKAEDRLIDVCKDHIEPPIEDLQTEKKSRSGEDLLIVRVPEADSEVDSYEYDGTPHGRIVHHTKELED